MNSKNDFQRHLSSKNVRNARSDFMAQRNTSASSTGVTSADKLRTGGFSSGSSSMLSIDNGDHTSTESVIQREESNFSSTSDELDMISLTEAAVGFGGDVTSPLEDSDNKKPASVKKADVYDTDGDMTQSFIRTEPKNNTENNSCCCECYHTTMKKYKGIGFLLCTLFILVMITTGIVLGTNEEEGEDDDNEDQPTISPTYEPTRNVNPNGVDYWCGIDKHHAQNECEITCSATGLDSECPVDQFCWSDITICSSTDSVDVNTSFRQTR